MAVFSCYPFEMVWREVSNIAVEKYYSVFASSKDCCLHPRDVASLHTWEGKKTRFPASVSLADTHSNVNPVLVKGPSAAPSESQNRSPFWSPFYLCYLSHSLTSLSMVYGCSPLVTMRSLESWLYLQKATAAVIQAVWEGKDWCCLKCIRAYCWQQTSQVEGKIDKTS